jgi:glycosyltransferase
MRVGGISNKNLRNILLKTTEDYRAIRKNKIGSIGTLVRKNTSKIKQFFTKKN